MSHDNKLHIISTRKIVLLGFIALIIVISLIRDVRLSKYRLVDDLIYKEELKETALAWKMPPNATTEEITRITKANNNNNNNNNNNQSIHISKTSDRNDATFLANPPSAHTAENEMINWATETIQRLSDHEIEISGKNVTDSSPIPKPGLVSVDSIETIKIAQTNAIINDRKKDVLVDDGIEESDFSEEKQKQSSSISKFPEYGEEKSDWYPSDTWLSNCSAELSAIETGPFNVVGAAAIGDCIKLCQCYRKPPWTMNYQFKDRACRTKATRQPGNLTIVDEIHKIQEKMSSDFVRPDNDTLVIHLRLGDVIEKITATPDIILSKGASPAHVGAYKNSLKSVHEYLENIQESGMSKVSIVGGSHMPDMYKKSRVYAGCLYRAIKQAGYNVTMRIEGYHPDHDFYYMSHAKKIVVSAGGYSNLIGLLVEYRGGEVVGRKFQSQFLELGFFQPPKSDDDIKEIDGGSVATFAGVEKMVNNASDQIPDLTNNDGVVLHPPQSEISYVERETKVSSSAMIVSSNNSSLSPSELNTWLSSCSAELSAIETGPFNVVAGNAIGDCIKLCNCYSHPPWTMNQQFRTRACPKTATQQRGNLTIVDEIHKIQEKTSSDFVRPDNDTLVIHLRLGDVIEKISATPDIILSKGASPAHRGAYRNSLKSVHEYLENIQESGMSKVSIVGGSHMPNMYKKSRVYAGCLYRAIKQAGYNVTMRIEGYHPDYDFYYMSHAKKIVVSAGGYSNLIGLLVEYRGGEVVGRKFQSQFLGLDFFQPEKLVNDSGVVLLPSRPTVELSTVVLSRNNSSGSPAELNSWLSYCSTELSAVETRPFNVVANNAIGTCIRICQCYPNPSWTMNHQFKIRACKTKSTRQPGNLTIVDEIHKIQEKMSSDFVRPDNHTLVIHLLLGDVIEKISETPDIILSKGASPAHKFTYKNSLKSVQEYLENIQESGMSKVSIVGGSREPDMYKKSRVYAECLYRAVEQAGYNVTMRIEGRHPDHDFYYMSHAKKIVVSTGAFSNLIGLLVEHRGGEIVGRKFQSQFSGLDFFQSSNLIDNN